MKVNLVTIVICWQFIIEKSLELWQYLQANFPIYMEMVSKSFADAIQFTANTWQKITEVNSLRKLTLLDLMQYIHILGILKRIPSESELRAFIKSNIVICICNISVPGHLCTEVVCQQGETFNHNNNLQF